MRSDCVAVLFWSRTEKSFKRLIGSWQDKESGVVIEK